LLASATLSFHLLQLTALKWCLLVSPIPKSFGKLFQNFRKAKSCCGALRKLSLR
jgi:hypothetical protein